MKEKTAIITSIIIGLATLAVASLNASLFGINLPLV